jgi:hypothetical protein
MAIQYCVTIIFWVFNYYEGLELLAGLDFLLVFLYGLSENFGVSYYLVNG